MMEEWREIPGYEGFYWASSEGRIRNRFGKIRTLSNHRDGYLKISLSVRNAKTTGSVHRLVASAFIPNPENKPQINHKDGNKRNNIISNLEWSTSEENNNHAYETGLNKCIGSNHHQSKLTESDVIEIREKYSIGNRSYSSLSEEYGVSKGTIAFIIRRVYWQHI
jgi:hypothetical protein